MLFERLSEIFTSIIASTGYSGIFLLMALESMVAPVPSELVMPFAGFLVADGTLKLWLVIIVSSLASVAGSLASYFIAFFGGKELIRRFGRFIFLDEEELEWTGRWFKNRGSITILLSRFIPVVRHLISIPAGLARMNIARFTLYTFIGAAAWNTILLSLGMKLRENWALVHDYSRQLDILIAVFLALAVLYIAYKHVKRHRKKPIQPNKPFPHAEQP